MNALYVFVAYSLQALEFLVVEQFKWVSLALLIALSFATITTLRSPDARSRSVRLYLFPLLLLIAFPVTIAIGVLFAAPALGHRNHVGYWLLNGVDFLAVLFAIYSIYRCKGIRWFAATAVVAELWVILGATFIAGMSVAGDWI
jgi:hypothetical protein